jgi:hypothetical protein
MINQFEIPNMISDQIKIPYIVKLGKDDLSETSRTVLNKVVQLG